MSYAVERKVIKPLHPFYNECDNLSFLSKNLFNLTTYHIRQQYFKNKTILSYLNLYYLLRETSDYQGLPDKISKQIIKQTQENFVSFTKLNKLYFKKKLKGKPKLPYYLNKTNGRFMVKYPKDAINHKDYKITGCYKLSKTNLLIETKLSLDSIKEVRIVKQNLYYVIEIVYQKSIKELNVGNNIGSIDLGVTNLMTLTYNTGDCPVIFSGNEFKSYNQWYNKRKSYLQSCLSEGVYNSKNLKKLNDNRYWKLNDMLHKVTKELVNQIVSKQVGTLFVGYNKEWKQDVGLGVVNNQNFVYLPHRKMLNMLTYKCSDVGIRLVEINESYTSKCSFLDDETIGFHQEYVGNRIKRGLFTSHSGVSINSDVNGSYNIMLKGLSIELGLNVSRSDLMRSYDVRSLSIRPVRVTVKDCCNLTKV